MLLALVMLPEVVVPVSSESVPAVVVLPDSPQPVPVVVVVPKASPEASPEPKVEAAVVPEPIGAPLEPTGQHRTPSAESCSHAPRQSSGRSALSTQYRWQAPEASSSERGAGVEGAARRARDGVRRGGHVRRVAFAHASR